MIERKKRTLISTRHSRGHKGVGKESRGAKKRGERLLLLLYFMLPFGKLNESHRVPQFIRKRNVSSPFWFPSFNSQQIQETTLWITERMNTCVYVWRAEN